MRPTSESISFIQRHLFLRFCLMMLVLLLTNGLVLIDMPCAVNAAEKKSSSEASTSSTKEDESTAKQPKSDELETDTEDSSEKPASRKETNQKSKVSKSDSEVESNANTKESAKEEKQGLENEKAKADEEAGAEVEVVDDSEEEDPEDVVEEESPIVEETKKDSPKVDKRVIGATATIMEKKSELLFRARVDSGAKSCSLHIEDMKIEDESDNMADNIGKVVRFNIKNGSNESHWLEAKIAGYVIIKTSNASDDRKRRYKVPLTFRYKDFEKTVLVTLNNREHMEFPLLLGRNFLKNDFLVDVDIDSND